MFCSCQFKIDEQIENARIATLSFMCGKKGEGVYRIKQEITVFKIKSKIISGIIAIIYLIVTDATGGGARVPVFIFLHYLSRVSGLVRQWEGIPAVSDSAGRK